MNVIYSINSKLAGSGIGEIAYNAVSGINRHKNLKRVISIGHKKTEIPENKIKNIFFPPKPPYFPRKYYYLLRNAFFDRMTKTYIDKCDIFHGWNSQCPSSLIKAKTLGAKTVVERASSHVLTHEKLVNEEYRRLGIDYYVELKSVIKNAVKEYEIADYVTVPSDFVYNSFLEHGFDKNKLIKIPFGVDTKKFKPRKKEDNIFRALFVGQVIPRKGVQYLLRAWNLLQLKNSEMLIAGDIEKRTKKTLKKDIAQKNIKTLNWVDNTKKIYNNSSVFVFPTIEEGSALVVYEAMASGLPVIVTENAGSLAKDGKDGFIVPIRNVEILKQRIQYFYDNPKEIKRMGRNAWKKAKKYTWKKYGDNLVKEYKKIV